MNSGYMMKKRKEQMCAIPELLPLPDDRVFNHKHKNLFYLCDLHSSQSMKGKSYACSDLADYIIRSRFLAVCGVPEEKVIMTAIPPPTRSWAMSVRKW